MTTRCCEFFLDFLNIGLKNASAENLVNNDGKQFDYVVEKLVVQRVPIAFISMQKQCLENTNNSSNGSTHLSREINSIKDISNCNKQNHNLEYSLNKLNTIYTTSPQTQSLLYYSNKLNPNMLPLDDSYKCLHHISKTATPNIRNKKYFLPNNYHNSITDLVHTASNLHPNLNIHEKTSKDPCPLNLEQSQSSLTNNFAKTLLNISNENQKQTAAQLQTSTDESHLSKNEYGLISFLGNANLPQRTSLDVQNIYDTKCGDRVIHSTHNIVCNEEHLKSLIDPNQMNILGYDTRNCHLFSNFQSLTNEFKDASKSSMKSDLSNATLKWRIIIKHYKVKTCNSTISQENLNSFSVS